jgi:hypothetical protein
MPEHDDDPLYELVRKAAARPVDHALLTDKVLRRIRQERPGAKAAPGRFALPVFSHPARFAPIAFALILIATPFAVSHFPGDQTEAVIAALAMGDPMLLGPYHVLLLDQGRF